MLLSNCSNGVYNQLFGSTLKPMDNLKKVVVVLENYTLTSMSSSRDIRDYFGNFWLQWHTSPESILMITLLTEVGSNGYSTHLDKVVEFCERQDVPGSKIAIMAANTQSMQNINEYLVNKIPGVNVYTINYCEWDTMDFLARQGYTHLQTQVIEPKKKFMFLCRHMKPWRLYFLSLLYNKKVLDQFNFSFYNIDPYWTVGYKTYELEEIKDKLAEIDGQIAQDLLYTDFYQNMPYRLFNREDDFYQTITTNTVSEAFVSSDISITIETLFEYSENDFHHTEKTWKPIAFKKPFIMFSSHRFLKNLKKMGYSTFSPFIDESYDEIADPKERVNAIVNEIDRINNLNEEDYKKLLEGCNERAEFNYNRLLKRQQNFYLNTHIDPSIEWIFNRNR